MGLDTVELIIAVEDAFDITIPEDRFAEIHTVGDLYELVREQTAEKTADEARKCDICLSSATFLAIRRAVRNILGSDCLRIRPCESVDATLPREGRRAVWRELACELQLKLPPLTRPVWLVRLSGMAVAVLAASSGVMVSARFGWKTAVLTALGTLVAAGSVARIATRSFAILPSGRIATFRGLSQTVLAGNYATLSERYQSSSDIWNALKTLVADCLDVPEDAVTRDAHIVRDLGAD